MQRRWLIPTVVAAVVNLVAVAARVGSCGIHGDPCSGYASSDWAAQALIVAFWLGPFLGALTVAAWLAAIRAPLRAYAALPIVALPLLAVTVYAGAAWSPRPSDSYIFSGRVIAMFVGAWVLLTTLGGSVAGWLVGSVARRIRGAIRGIREDGSRR